MKTVKSFFKKQIKNKPFFYFALVLFISSCNSQAQKNEQFLSSNNTHTKYADTTNKPKISYKVNKQVDKNGNLIKYDSTYTYVYKGGEGKGFSTFNADSLMNSFNSNFNEQPFNLFKDNFFENSFFEKQMQLNDNFFKNFFKNLDSTELLYLKNKSSNSTIKKI